jgi:hypothetical protein
VRKCRLSNFFSLEQIVFQIQSSSGKTLLADTSPKSKENKSFKNAKLVLN